MILPIQALHFSEVKKIVEFYFQKSQFQFNWPLAAIEDELLKSTGFVFEIDHEVAAFILSRKQSVNIEEITCVALSPKFQKLGVMDSFFKLWVQEMKTQQISEVWLEVHENNLPAIRFYERNQFVKVAERAKYYADKNAAYLYNLYLDE